jgi:hypothetical protein
MNSCQLGDKNINKFQGLIGEVKNASRRESNGGKKVMG